MYPDEAACGTDSACHWTVYGCLVDCAQIPDEATCIEHNTVDFCFWDGDTCIFDDLSE